MKHLSNLFKNLLPNLPIIAIPLVTCFGYLYAYQLQIGSAKYYHIPRDMIRLDILQIIGSAVSIYLLLVTILTLSYALPDFSLLKRVKVRFLKDYRNNKHPTIAIIALVIACFLDTIVLTEEIGKLDAKHTRSYIVFEKDGKKYVIVKVYGDTIVVLGLDEKSNILTNRILMMPKDTQIDGMVERFNNIAVEE